VLCVFFNGHVNLGGSIKVDAIDLRGPSKVRPLIDSMEYNPDNGEVVVNTTLRCGLTGGKGPGRLRFPGAKVSHVIEDLQPSVPKAKVAEKPAAVA
jgi:hypothetical protein